MKKMMKTMFAALAISLFAGPAFAEVPVDVQKKVREVEAVQKVRKGRANAEKGKAKAEKGKTNADAESDAGTAADAGKGSAEKGREKAEKARANSGSEKVEHGKEDRLDESRRPARPEHAGPRPSPADEGSDVATKRNPSSSKGLDRRGKEERKHLRNLARIDRLAELAAQHKNGNLAQRVPVLREKENLRYTRALNKIDSPDMGE